MRASKQERIVELLTDKICGLTAREITDILYDTSTHQSIVFGKLQEMEQQGIVQRINDGKANKFFLTGNKPKDIKRHTVGSIKTDDLSYDRAKYFEDQFNEVWSTILGDKKDYFSKISPTNYDLLKVALSNINNIVTYDATLLFIEKIKDLFNLTTQEYEKLKRNVARTKPNDNGFDIHYEGSVQIIAEIKCNKPINEGNRFGSKQREGITKDLTSLIEGKQKANIPTDELKQYYKFMAIKNFGPNTEEAIRHYLSCIPSHLEEKVLLYEKESKLTTEYVYIFLL